MMDKYIILQSFTADKGWYPMPNAVLFDTFEEAKACVDRLYASHPRYYGIFKVGACVCEVARGSKGGDK